MNRKAILSVIGFLSLSSAVSLQAATAMGDTEKAMVALEQQWTQMQQANNADRGALFLADKYIGIDIDGKVLTKADVMADAKATMWTSVSFDHVVVTSYGTTAIATGVFTGKGTDSSGKPLNLHERDTDVWVKMSTGKWQCVASVSSPLKS